MPRLLPLGSALCYDDGGLQGPAVCVQLLTGGCGGRQGNVEVWALGENRGCVLALHEVGSARFRVCRDRRENGWVWMKEASSQAISGAVSDVVVAGRIE